MQESKNIVKLVFFFLDSGKTLDVTHVNNCRLLLSLTNVICFIAAEFICLPFIPLICDIKIAFPPKKYSLFFCCCSHPFFFFLEREKGKRIRSRIQLLILEDTSVNLLFIYRGDALKRLT